MSHAVEAAIVLAAEALEAVFDDVDEGFTLPDAAGITELCTPALLDEEPGEDEEPHVPRAGWQPEPQ